MNNENSLLNLQLDGDAAKVFADLYEKGVTPTFEIVTRQDEALPVLNHFEKRLFSKKVTVGSIAEYIFKRSFPADPKENKAIVIYCVHPERTRLDFHEDVNTVLTTDLSSSLTVNPDFKAFHINDTNVAFSMDNLLALIRTKAHCFAMAQDVRDFIKGFKNFEIKFNMHVEKKDDLQGNTKDLITTAIDKSKLEIPKTLRLKMPLFVAGPVIEFEAELEISRGKNNLPEFSFFNIDVEILLRNQASEIILKEVDKFRENFICLEVE